MNDLDWASDDIVDRIEALFHRRHEELYTYASPDQEVVFVNARVVAIGIVPQGASVSRGAAAVSACAPSDKRNAFFGAWKEVPVYVADMLKPGHAIEGPAIVEAETTTVVVNAGDRIAVNDLGWLDIALG